MARIGLHGCQATAPPPPLADLAGTHQLCDDAETDAVELHIHLLQRWSPAWRPETAGPNLVLSPRPPAEPLSAYLAGVDAWLPIDCSPTTLQEWIQALLDRQAGSGAARPPAAPAQGDRPQAEDERPE